MTQTIVSARDQIKKSSDKEKIALEKKITKAEKGRKEVSDRQSSAFQDVMEAEMEALPIRVEARRLNEEIQALQYEAMELHRDLEASGK